MHSDFSTINGMLPHLFLRKVLFTNGLLLTRNVLADLHVDEIQISVDGLEQAHDSIRGKGTFRKAMDAVTNALHAGFEVSISTMVHAGNLADFDRMDSLFRDLGIKDWTVDIPCITGRLAAHPDFQVRPETGGRFLSYGFGSGLHGGTEGFGCGLHLMAVMADGRIAKCTFYGDRAVGTVEDGLRTCWSRVQPVRLTDLACDCRHRETCRGGCRYRAELLGSDRGKDLYRCSLYGIIEETE
jgi:radical SAM protein with 4Fe4S-binding SPASM domain